MHPAYDAISFVNIRATCLCNLYGSKCDFRSLAIKATHKRIVVVTKRTVGASLQTHPQSPSFILHTKPLVSSRKRGVVEILGVFDGDFTSRLAAEVTRRHCHCNIHRIVRGRNEIELSWASDSRYLMEIVSDVFCFQFFFTGSLRKH